MADERTGAAANAVSRRWTEPAYDTAGNYWAAYLRQPPAPTERAAGVESHAFGPTRDACIAETQRLDALWAWIPMRQGDTAAVERRRAWLHGEGDGAC